ncbi:MAG: DUF4349 domain-containing protein [Oscillospiraceae bacterium]|jgi:hypothetical protein|nr:DUF4349 domain-containing protein [Oscillospiraceae bacterium]
MPRRTVREMAEHEACCPVCAARREEMYELIRNLHTLDSDIETPDELSIAWRQMIRMEKPPKRRIDTNIRLWIAVAALLVIMFGGATLVHMGLIPASFNSGDIPSDTLLPPISGIFAKTEQGGSALSSGDSSLLAPSGGAYKLLRNGSYTIKTTSFDEDRNAILDLTIQYGGWAQRNSVSGDPLTQEGKGGRFCALQIRVPETMLGGFLRSLDSLVDVTSSELQQQDYSDQYAETTTKLAGLQSQLVRLKQLLADTTGIEEIMTIEARIADLEAQISSIQGTLEGWDSRAMYPQIDIALTEMAVIPEGIGSTLWSRMRTQFGISMHAVGSYFMDMLVFITIAAPWIMVVAIMAGMALLVEKWHWRSKQL